MKIQKLTLYFFSNRPYPAEPSWRGNVAEQAHQPSPADQVPTRDVRQHIPGGLTRDRWQTR